MNGRTEPRVLRDMLDHLIDADMRMDFKSSAGGEGEVPYFTKFHYTNVVKQYMIFHPELEINIEQSFDDYLALGAIKEVPRESKYGLENPYQDVYHFVSNPKSKIKMKKKRMEPDVPRAIRDNEEWWNG